MKRKHEKKIGEYTVVWLVDDAVVDPVKTMKKVDALKTPGMTGADKKRLYEDNLVYSDEDSLIEDSEADLLQEKLKVMGKSQMLLTNGEYIEDHRGKEYWIKRSDAWIKEKCEEIGIPLPEGAVQQEELTQEQNQEIHAQQEEERFAALTPKQQDEEMERKLLAKLEEIDRLEGASRPIRETLKHLAGVAGLDTSRIMTHEPEADAIRAELDPIQRRLGKKGETVDSTQAA